MAAPKCQITTIFLQKTNIKHSYISYHMISFGIKIAILTENYFEKLKKKTLLLQHTMNIFERNFFLKILYYR